MTILEELTRHAETLSNPFVEQWKQSGGKALGYFCSQVPVEIIHAGELLPFRMRATGSINSYLGDAHMYHTTCSFCRHTLDQVLRGKYRFLDGLVALYSCDHIRRLYDILANANQEQPDSHYFFNFLSVPTKIDEESIRWFSKGLNIFKCNLQKHFGVTISDQALQHSIALYNEKRELLRNLYDLRKLESPPISGTEVLQILISGDSIPVEEFNGMLRSLLDELKGHIGSSTHEARLLLAGGELEDVDYVKTIENLGGLVVTDFLCFGTRDFWYSVDTDSSPIEALAKGYLQRVSCPRMIDHKRRQEFVVSLAKDFHADGIIIQRMKYCDSWGGESVMMEWDMKKEDIPCMILEREYLSGSGGQLGTRVQAFLEIIGR
ncbi:MAG: 2-hydroxyacyl-CoA dehydratase family protein [Chloroflexota bacterium]|nr:2-hydroxyacyl-CoA dehydratase family protein [Chloroflexota bacterium]